MGDRGQSGVSPNPLPPREGVHAAAQELCAKSQFMLGNDRAGSAERLLRLLEAEIIPRLMLAHRVSRWAVDRPMRCPDRADVTELVQILEEDDIRRANDFVRGMIERGVALEAIFLDLFAPAAKRIGELWEDDLSTFTDVTIMLSRLQCLVREMSAVFGTRVPRENLGHLAVLCPAPGEQHIFGITLLEELLRRDGWEVLCEKPANVLESVRRRFVTMLGFTASDGDRVEGLTALIRTAREVSENRELLVIVGGRCFTNHPERVDEVGADLTAHDAREAVRLMQAHLRTKNMAVGASGEGGAPPPVAPSTPSGTAAELGPLATSTRR